ncbi:hypothetical protein BU26DRAFT_564114 [Trematosphaeria pertusa]|uniref:Uncharacterized protein n=1 Tax=Trematosphaeria pertusa TaxID=390896 RepID=A0A6A6IIK2_9PLEO|nr:uncharacterized protein BU26DRAFT_564114 [Trematosphaeria pertusa]KAF2250241.1 hypothetical protein BU26DRAFT_564114 [Trematosphaeria pertusa]
MNLTGSSSLAVVLVLCLLAGASTFIADLSAASKNSSAGGSSTTTSTGAGSLHRRASQWDVPHPADDKLWDKSVCKGAALIEAIRVPEGAASHFFDNQPKTIQGPSLLEGIAGFHSLLSWTFANHASPPVAVQSPFVEFPQSFEDWGWKLYDGDELNPRNGDFEWSGWGIADALRGIGVSDKPYNHPDGKIRVSWVHHGPAWDDNGDHNEVRGQTYAHNGRQYPFTDAHFQYGINPEEGVIIALNLKAPEFTKDLNDQVWPKDQLPELRRCSDVMYGLWKFWKNMIGQKDSFKRLRYYAVAAITNQDSKEIIVRAVGTDDIPEWKESIWVGIGTYDQLNEPGVALLGAPSSWSLGYLLIQHKADFGDLRPVGVRVFMCNSEAVGSTRKVCLLWYLKDAPPPPPNTSTTSSAPSASGSLRRVRRN